MPLATAQRRQPAQPGQIGWRLARRAALGRQHGRSVPERGALTERDALVCRAYRRQAIGVVGPVTMSAKRARWPAVGPRRYSRARLG